MRKAVIDLGTNTFNLLIGEMAGDRPKIIHSFKVPVLLGMGGINEKKISEDAYYRALNAIHQFKQTCEEFGVEQINAIGTSALRDATNRHEFVANIYKMTGVQINVVSGPEEAELIRKGVQLTHSFEKHGLIMDIGGGSTEFIFCDNTHVEKSISLNVGVSRIYQKLGHPRFYGEKEKAFILKELENHRHEFEAFKTANELVGSSGSFETFYDMIHEVAHDFKDTSLKVDAEEFYRVLDWTIHSTHQDRIDNQWIIPLRKDMLPISAMMVKWVMDTVGIDTVWVSPYSLKEGAFLD